MSHLVTIYNNGGTEKLGYVSLRKAVNMVHRGVAKVHTVRPGGNIGPFERPAAVELVTYIFAKWIYKNTGRTLYSKTGVLRRDKYQCGYCGRSATTVDHVIPQCQGGESIWENTIASCWSCNQFKAGRTPAQAKMRLQWLPKVPSVDEAYKPHK